MKLIRYIIIWIICILIAMIIGTVIRKKLNVSKKVHDIVLLILGVANVIGIVLMYTTNIPIYDLRGYISSIIGLGLGWILSSYLVKKKNDK